MVDLALHRAVPTAYDQSGLLVTKLTKSQVAIRYKQDLAIRLIQRRWRASDTLERRDAATLWRERAKRAYDDDDLLRRRLVVEVTVAVTQARATEVAAQLVDYDEVMHQARTQMAVGVKGCEAVATAVAGELKWREHQVQTAVGSPAPAAEEGLGARRLDA